MQEDAASLGRLVGSWHQETGSAVTVAVARTEETAFVVLAGTLTGVGADGRKTTRAEVYRVPQPTRPDDWLGLAADAHHAISNWRGLGEIPFSVSSTPRSMPQRARILGLSAIVDHLSGNSPWIHAENPEAALGVFEELFPQSPDIVLLADAQPRDADRWKTPLLLSRRRQGDRRPAETTERSVESLPALWSLGVSTDRRQALWRFAVTRGIERKLEPTPPEAAWLVGCGLKMHELWPVGIDTAESLFRNNHWAAAEARWILESGAPAAELAAVLAHALADHPTLIPAFVSRFGAGHKAVVGLLSHSARVLHEAILTATPVSPSGDADASELAQAGLIGALSDESLAFAIGQTQHRLFWQEAVRRATDPAQLHILRSLALGAEPADLTNLSGLAEMPTRLLHALPATALRQAFPHVSLCVASPDHLLARVAERPDFGEQWRLELTHGSGDESVTWLRGRIRFGQIARRDAVERMLRGATGAAGIQRWMALFPDLGLPLDGLFAAWLELAPIPAAPSTDETALWRQLLADGAIDGSAVIQRASVAPNQWQWLRYAGLPAVQLSLLLPGSAGAPRLPVPNWDPRLTSLLAEVVTQAEFWATPGLSADLPALDWLATTLAATTAGGELAIAVADLRNGTALTEATLAKLLPALDEAVRTRQTVLRWEPLQRDLDRAARFVHAVVRQPELKRWLLNRLDPLAPPGPEPTAQLSTGVVLALSPLLSASEVLRFAINATGPMHDWEALASQLRRKSAAEGLLLSAEPLLRRLTTARPELAAALERVPTFATNGP
jgi:hypothetical protein